MNTDIMAMQAEIDRLNTIISVLVEKNQQLQKEITLLTPGSTGTDNNYVPGENSAGIEKQENSLGENRSGIEKEKNILGENWHGIEKEKNTLGENPEGIKKRKLSLAKICQG